MGRKHRRRTPDHAGCRRQPALARAFESACRNFVTEALNLGRSEGAQGDPATSRPGRHTRRADGLRRHLSDRRQSWFQPGVEVGIGLYEGAAHRPLFSNSWRIGLPCREGCDQPSPQTENIVCQLDDDQIGRGFRSDFQQATQRDLLVPSAETIGENGNSNSGRAAHSVEAVHQQRSATVQARKLDCSNDLSPSGDLDS